MNTWSVRVQLFAEDGKTPTELLTIRVHAESAAEARDRVERHTWVEYGKVKWLERVR